MGGIWLLMIRARSGDMSDAEARFLVKVMLWTAGLTVAGFLLFALIVLNY